MKKKSKFYVAAVGCIAAGIVLTGVGVAAGGWPGISLGPSGIHLAGESRREKPYVLEKTKLDEFSSFTFHVDYADLSIIPSDGYYLEYRLSGTGGQPKYEIKNDTFTLSEKPNNGFGNIQFFSWGNIDFGFNSDEKYYVNLYVPKDKLFEDVGLYNDCGHVIVENLQADNMEFDLSYGDLTADTLTGKSISMDMDSGTVKANKIEAEELRIGNSYGHVKVQEILADNAEISMDSGDFITGKIRTEDFLLQDDYGNVRMAEASIGTGTMGMDSGDLEILQASFRDLNVESSYGGVSIELKEDPALYSMNLSTEYGSVHTPFPGRYISEDSEESFEMDGTENRRMSIHCDSGDINITSSQTNK